MTKTNLNETNNELVIPFGIKVVAVLMILFGLAEVVTGFTHYFLVSQLHKPPSLHI